MHAASIVAFFADFPIELFIIQTLNGIVTGMILALIASGLTLIFGIMDVVNFAHGELFMLGAYVGVVVMAATGSFWLALVVATLVVALIGAALCVVMKVAPAKDVLAPFADPLMFMFIGAFILALGVLVVLFFAVTMVKGPGVLVRPM